MADLTGANEYHEKRLTSAVWFRLTDALREQALQSAADLLGRFVKGVAPPPVLGDYLIYEQAAYMTTPEYTVRKNRISSQSLDKTGSISYYWDKNRGLLAPEIEDEFEDIVGEAGTCLTGVVR